MKYFILFLSFLITSINSISQDLSDYIKISGTVTDKTSDIGISGVEIKILRSGVLVEKVITDSLGKYQLKNLPLNAIYEIHFSKKKYCYKFAKISILDNSTLEGIFSLEVNCGLFKVGTIKNFRLRFLRKEPVAIAIYDNEEDNMAWNLEYIELMANKIQRKGGK